MKYSICGNLFTLAVTITVATSLFLSYSSQRETYNSSILMFQLQQQQSEFTEKQTLQENSIKELKSSFEKIQSDIQSDIRDIKKDLEQLSQIKSQVELVKNELVIAQFDILRNGNQANSQKELNEYKIDQIATKVELLQQKNEQISTENVSQSHNLSILQNNLKKDFEYLSELKTDVESMKKELVKAQVDTIVNGNNTNIHINNIEKVFDQIVNKVDALETNQMNLRLIDSILTKVDALEKDHSDILINENSLITQVNSTLNKIDQFKAEIDVLPVLSAKLDSLGLTVPQIQDQLDTLSQKINVDTFNKVELFGPYYPSQHSISISVTNSEYKMFETLEPCIISLQGKAIVTLIATGHAYSYGQNNSQISFMKNRKVNLPFTKGGQWQFGAQFVFREWCPVNLTQELMLEKGVYEFALGTNYPDGSTTILLNAVSFVAKVTYIS